MSASAPGSSPAGGAPLLITAGLPADIFAWADALRRAHYPAERNRMAAHVTLFHALPPSAEGEVRRLLAEFARAPAPEARISGLMDLGRGTALAVESPALVAMHADLAERLQGVAQQRDVRPLRLHITIQNKVSRPAAQALQQELSGGLDGRPFRFRGLELHLWRDELWRFSRAFAFGGARRKHG